MLNRIRGIVFAPGEGSRVLRYVITSGITTATYTGLTLALNAFAGVPLQLAIIVSFVLAIVLHFQLQRRFVFHDAGEFAVSTQGQAGRYVAIATVQYLLTAASTAWLPDALGVHERIVYLVTVAVISLATFLILRLAVFHSAGAGEPG